MERRVTFRQSELERVIRALKAAGEEIGGVEVKPDGAFKVLTVRVSGAKLEPEDAFEQWERKQAGKPSAGLDGLNAQHGPPPIKPSKRRSPWLRN